MSTQDVRVRRDHRASAQPARGPIAVICHRPNTPGLQVLVKVELALR